MCSTCGKHVGVTALKPRETCAGSSTLQRIVMNDHTGIRGKDEFLPVFPPSSSTRLSTPFKALTTVVSRMFSTLSTVPITNTTKERKVKN